MGATVVEMAVPLGSDLSLFHTSLSLSDGVALLYLDLDGCLKHIYLVGLADEQVFISGSSCTGASNLSSRCFRFGLTSLVSATEGVLNFRVCDSDADTSFYLEGLSVASIPVQSSCFLIGVVRVDPTAYYTF